MSVSDERLALLLDGAKLDVKMQTSARYKREAEELVLILSELSELRAAAKVRAIREGDGLLSAVIALIEDDMYGPGEAEGVPEREAFNRACRRQVNRITSRLIVAPKLNATQEGK